MSAWKLCLVLWLGGVFAARATALLPLGQADWRWRHEVGPAGGLPAAGWNSPDADDSAWSRGAAGFSSDFTGGWYGIEASVIGVTPTNGATLFRGKFILEQPEAARWLVLRIDWSGGFVAYLNGKEVARRNLPGEPGQPVPFGTLAAYRAKGGSEEIDCTFARGQLMAGTNVLAIQWHPWPGQSDAGLVPELLANFTRGPFVQSTTPRSQTIVWRTPVPADSRVRFGPTPAVEQSWSDTNLVLQHIAVLTNLAPDTVWHYQVESAASNEVAQSGVFSFRTLKDSGPVSFVVTADVGNGNRAHFDVAERMRQAQPDLVLLAGDAVYPRFTAALADQRFFSVHRAQMSATPVFVVPGNHDTIHTPPGPFFEAVVNPTNSVPPATHALAGTGPEHYFSFDHGDAHFACLYLPLYLPGLELVEGSAQWNWLEADLAASTKPWKFMVAHMPPLSSGPHFNDDYNLNGVADSAELAAALLPLARRHGVQMIFGGHDHGYERFHPVEGVHCVVSGGGGGPLYSLELRHPASAQHYARWHFVQVDVDGDELHLRAIGTDGKTFDEMFIRRTPPSPAEWETAWGTPEVEPAGAPDGDGNHVGQRFAFGGAPILAVAGEFSNAGRVWVNRDHTRLYVGFESVMLPADADLFLFLESPAVPGVTTMKGLGNGRVDAETQGADALDFIENLGFVNFTPAFAAVLGDEAGDRTERRFRRPGSGLAGGQGAFRLDAGLSEVSGVRLQQFNRSPQAEPVPGEENADFIVLSMPLAELGLEAGDVFKLGAVVGGGQYDLAVDRQARVLDRSFLGNALTGSGFGPVSLEGLPVRLGPDLDRDEDGLTDAEEALLGTRPDAADSDDDGLPDGWEARHTLDPLSGLGDQGPAGDPDKDGLTNAGELAAGTNPRNAASTLRLGTRLLAGDTLEFTWNAVPGKRYHLQESDLPQLDFRDLSSPGLPVTATGVVASFGLPAGTPAPGPRFFRLRLVP